MTPGKWQAWGVWAALAVAVGGAILLFGLDTVRLA